MKVTKYPQSHLIIEKNGKKLCIDPGDWTFDKGFKPKQFQDAEAFLITHSHYDHVPEKHVEEFKKMVGDKPIYGNSDTLKRLQQIGLAGIEIKNNQEFEVAGFDIKAIDVPHVRIDDAPAQVQNTGYLIDKVFFHSGDGLEIENVTVENAVLPIGHVAISFNDVLRSLKKLNAKLLIPIHYDSYVRDPAELIKAIEFYKLGFEVKPLKYEEETEI